MALTVIMSIISSLVLALIMVPVLMSYMERIPYFANINVHEEGYKNQKILKKYRKFLTWAFDVPRRAILISISLPLLGFLIFGSIPKDFFPANDRDMFRIHIELPTNSSSTKTLEKVQEIRNQVIDSNLIELDKDYWFIGRWMPRVLMNIVGGEEKNGGNNHAQAVFFAKDYYEMIENLPKLSKMLVAQNSDLIIFVDSFQTGPPVFSDIQYSIIGDDENVLRAIGSELELIINNAPDVSHTKSLAGYSNTNIEFEFNSSNVSLSGKNTELLVNELYAENNGIVVSSMLDSNKEIPIRVKGIRESSDIIGNTGYLSIPAKDGIDFIGNYGQATINKTSSYVTRRNSQRVNQVEGWIWTGTLPHKTEQYLEEKFNEFESNLPPGYSIIVGGEAESRGQSQSQIYSSAIIYLLLITFGLVFALTLLDKPY